MYKNLFLCMAVALISSLIFGLFQITFSADISLLALPLSLAFVAWLFYESYVQVFRKSNIKRLPIVFKLLQYLPYILLASFVFRRAGAFDTAHWYDIITVLLWVIVLVSSHGALYYLNPKRIYIKNPDLKETAGQTSTKERSIVKKVIFEALDWIDAFVQAICTVVLINIFIFQLYEIPSESMVSEFLVRDRVVGLKLDAGPKFPLSDVGIPEMKSYDRGDIVIFSNPHYSDDRESEIRTFVSQLVYMLTLTTVNLNVDEDGNLKADPLVKRITGIEGEQLVMQDGILYSRTTGSDTFIPVQDDALWAEWNVGGLSQDILNKVQYVPMDEYEYNIMLDVELARSNLNLQDAQEEAENLALRFAQIKGRNNASQGTIREDSFSDNNALQVYSFLSQSDDLIRNLYYSNGGAEWFLSFMTDWVETVPSEAFMTGYVSSDIYADAMFKQNLMLKLSFGRLALRTAELLEQGVSSNAQRQDTQRLDTMQEAQNLAYYILSINDMRNMSVFPPNDENGNAQYIKKDHFFVMGDNRFNSLDMRHSYDYTRTKITEYDPWSLYYDSNLSPQEISTDDILGTPVLRFYPFNRFGVPGGN